MRYEVLKEACKRKGISINQLEKNLGFARGSLCKIDKHVPSMDKIYKICDELDIPYEMLALGYNFDDMEEMKNIPKTDFVINLQDKTDEEVKDIELIVEIMTNKKMSTHLVEYARKLYELYSLEQFNDKPGEEPK